MEKLNRTYKFNAAVYVVRCGEFGNWELVKGRVCGVHEFRTAYSAVIYAVDTPYGVVDVLPCNLYESVEEFAQEAPQHVAE